MKPSHDVVPRRGDSSGAFEAVSFSPVHHERNVVVTRVSGRVRKALTLVTVLVATVLLAACAGESTKLPADQVVVGSQDARFDFAQAFPFAWDRVYVFAPYATQADIEESLGFAWDGYESTTVGRSDTVCLVVFTSGQRVEGWFEQARSVVDLAAAASSEGYDRGAAVFDVQSGTSSTTLVPAR